MRDLNTNEVPSNNNVSQTSGLGTDSSHMEPFSGSVDESFNVQRQRLSECLCYICKEKVGADHSQRICKYKGLVLTDRSSIFFRLCKERL